MSMTVTVRSGIDCDHCSQAALAMLGPNSVIVIEQDGYASAFCQSHAEQFMGPIRLYRVLHPEPEPTGRELRDQGMDLAAAAEGTTWAVIAYATLERLVRGELPTQVAGELHADDLEAHLEWEPRSRNALGPVWARAIREGLIEWTGRMRHSERRDAHARLCKVYRVGTQVGRQRQEQKSA